MISDRLYRLLLSSGITFGGLGVAWILMKAIVPSKEEMLKVFTCEIFVKAASVKNSACSPAILNWISGEFSKQTRTFAMKPKE